MSFIKEQLTQFKDRLLDLSKRNRMLNSNFKSRGKQQFRFIDEIPDQLYERLLKSSMQFIPLPNPKDEPLDEKSDEFINELEIAIYSDEIYLSEIKKIEESNLEDDINQEITMAIKNWEPRARVINVQSQVQADLNNIFCRIEFQVIATGSIEVIETSVARLR